MFEYLPLIAFQIAFAAAGLAILYRIVGGRLSSADTARHASSRGKTFRKAAAAARA